jgi:hypothetical protein
MIADPNKRANKMSSGITNDGSKGLTILRNK